MTFTSQMLVALLMIGLVATERNLLQPMRNTIKIWVATRHHYGISAIVAQASFRVVVVSRNVDYFLEPYMCHS